MYSTPMASRPRFLLVTLGLFILTIGFGLGVLVTASSGNNPPAEFSTILSELRGSSTQADWVTFQRVWEDIHQNYYKNTIDDQALLRGATKGLVNALGDPYSVYLTPEESDDFQSEIEGTFEGTGMEIGMKNDVLTVIAPLADSPAEKAGVKAGDQIVSIDGQDAAGLSLTDAVYKIRGPKGSQVKIELRQNDETRNVTITRETIKIESVTSRTETVNGKTVGYIQISSFGSDTGRAFQRTARKLLEDGVSGFVIDLRNNPGGLLDQAVTIASAFIPEGVIVKEVERDGQSTNLDAQGGAFLADQKVVVLVNGGSASASEIVAGALQDTKHATIVGEQTFGKGTVQDFQLLSDGSSLKLTIAEWHTPNDRSINAEGITPDVEVKSDDQDTDDVQLQEALKQLGL